MAGLRYDAEVRGCEQDIMEAFVMRTASEIVAAINSFAPTDENWDELDDLTADLGSRAGGADGIEAMLRVFERFPDEAGHGVFWSILHRLEGIPGYEGKLVESVRRAPSAFSLRMVNRLLNAGVESVNGTPLVGLLRHAASDPTAPPTARATAGEFARLRSEKATEGD